MITVEYVMKDRVTNFVGRYQFAYDDEAELMKILDLDMLLTVPEMVECVMNEFTQQDMNDLAALKEDELINLHHTIGQDIRNAFGLWIDGNPNVEIHPDDTSMEVLESLWNILQNSVSKCASKTMEFV